MALRRAAEPEWELFFGPVFFFPPSRGVLSPPGLSIVDGQRLFLVALLGITSAPSCVMKNFLFSGSIVGASFFPHHAFWGVFWLPALKFYAFATSLSWYLENDVKPSLFSRRNNFFSLLLLVSPTRKVLVRTRGHFFSPPRRKEITCLFFRRKSSRTPVFLVDIVLL